MVGTIQKTVTLAITPEAISAVSDANAATGFRVSWATIQNTSTNTGPVKVRAPLVSSPVGYEIINAGDSLVLWSPSSLHEAIDLTKVFVEVFADGEKVNVIFVK